MAFDGEMDSGQGFLRKSEPSLFGKSTMQAWIG